MKATKQGKPYRLNLDDPRHKAVRLALQVVGPMIFAVGLGLLIVALVSFFQLFASFGSGEATSPRYFWCAFLGMPLMWLGGVLSIPAYMATASRFMAKEMIPIQRDAFNTLAEGTTDGVRTLAQTVGEGFATAGRNLQPANFWVGCGSSLPEHACFCPGCGQAL